tara:strand:- start:535 stop:930 length:396 start_codon:yes stop_codon:yes gene_type:complete
VKITTTYLKQVIKEELQKILKEEKETITPKALENLRQVAIDTFKNAGNLVKLAVADSYDPTTGIVTMPKRNRNVSFTNNLELKVLDNFDPEGIYHYEFLHETLMFEVLKGLKAEGFFTGGEDTINTINLNF